MIDLQSGAGQSPFHIDSVGVTNLRYPIQAKDGDRGETQHTVADWTMGVSLTAQRRGTHMSRFIAELHKRAGEPMTLDDHLEFARHLLDRLEADDGTIMASFPWFRAVRAPVTGQEAMIDCQMAFESKVKVGGAPEKILHLRLPAKALCPCSKAISDRGAHNQRTDIAVALFFAASERVPAFDRIIEFIEGGASSPVYPLLKREDEKYVTEYAYDHPVFVEDVVRNVANRLQEVSSASGFQVEAINRESIHAHDCYAKLSFSRR